MGQHDLNKVQKLLPNENCSLCAAPSCSTLARRIVAGKISPEQCPLLDKSNVPRIKEILAEGVETAKEVTQDTPFVEIQPCAEYGRVTLEAQLPRPKGSVYDLFDSCTMCTAFSDISDLDGVKCSLELGYGLAHLEEKRIHVFRSGKVTMRRAYDRRDAYDTLEMISRSLWPSVICSCGCTVQECISCACDECRDEVCPGIEWGIRDIPHRSKPLGEYLKDTLKDVTNGQADEATVAAVKKYKAGIEHVKTLLGLLIKADAILEIGELEAMEPIRKEFHEVHMALAKLAIEILVRTKGPGRLLGLILNGVEWNMNHMGKGLFSIRNKEDDQLYGRAFELAMEGTRVLTDIDIDNSKKMLEGCEAFNTDWKARPYSEVSELVLKVGMYGCFLARMLSRQMPVWTLEDEKVSQPTTMSEGESCN